MAGALSAAPSIPRSAVYLVDFAELRSGPSEHESRTKGHLVRLAHEEPSEYSVGSVALLRHADERR